MKQFSLLLPICLLAFLAACGPSATPPKADPHAQLQAEMEKASLDFSKVLVVRLLRDGKRVEVSSVMPAMVAEATVDGQIAKTIFRVSDRGDGLVLFSRDVRNHKSFRTELALSQITANRQFSFVVVQPDGSLKEASFALERIVTPE